MMIARSMCVALLASTLPWPGSVQTVSAQSDVWTTNGPEGGTITTLASDPLTPDTLYAGTWNNGVFKSIDGGGRWINMGLLDTGVDALAIDPQTPDTVYTGTYTLQAGDWGKKHGARFYDANSLAVSRQSTRKK